MPHRLGFTQPIDAGIPSIRPGWLTWLRTIATGKAEPARSETMGAVPYVWPRSLITAIARPIGFMVVVDTTPMSANGMATFTVYALEPKESVANGVAGTVEAS